MSVCMQLSECGFEEDKAEEDKAEEEEESGRKQGK